MFILDCDKGLVEADAVLGEHCICAYCCKYLEGNLKDKFGAKEGLPALFGRPQECVCLVDLTTTWRRLRLSI